MVSAAQIAASIPASPVPHWTVRGRADGSLIVRHSRTNAIIAQLVKMKWGKWKIVGEDAYARTPEELLQRLSRRPS